MSASSKESATKITKDYIIKISTGNLGMHKLSLAAENLEAAISKDQTGEYEQCLSLFDSNLKKALNDISIIKKNLLPESNQPLSQIETPETKQIITRFKELLDANDIEAEEYYYVLKKAMDTDQHKSNMEPLGKFIASFDYDSARKQLEIISPSPANP